MVEKKNFFKNEKDDERTGTKCTNCIFRVQLRTIFPWRIFFLRQEDTRIRFFKIFVLRCIGKKTKLILFLYLDTNPDSFRIRFNFYQIFLDKFFVKTGG